MCSRSLCRVKNRSQVTHNKKKKADICIMWSELMAFLLIIIRVFLFPSSESNGPYFQSPLWNFIPVYQHLSQGCVIFPSPGQLGTCARHGLILFFGSPPLPSPPLSPFQVFWFLFLVHDCIQMGERTGGGDDLIFIDRTSLCIRGQACDALPPGITVWAS